MKLPKLQSQPPALIEFFQFGLERLGAVCERPWHNRLEVLAEGPAAILWDSKDDLYVGELNFPEPGEPGPRDASTQVFPGCPLTFRLVETLWNNRIPQFVAYLAAPPGADRQPALPVAEKIWQNQFGPPARANFSSWEKTVHLSLVAAVRCEIQAIDQHWSFHRLAFSLYTGQPDERLAANLDYCNVDPEATEQVSWPEVKPEAWQSHLKQVLWTDLGHDLSEIKKRQERYLKREMNRVDEYFINYQEELQRRMDQQRKAESKVRYQDRIRAAQLEHKRRRDDLAKRHEIRVVPHLDCLLLVAEMAWLTQVGWHHRSETTQATFLPRARRWFIL